MGKNTAEQHARDQENSNRTQAASDRTAAIEARAPLRARVQARRHAIATHDYDHAPDFIGNNNIAAERNKRMENQADLTSTGIAGLGTAYASADSVAMAAKLLKDRQAQVTGGQFEEDVNNYIRGTDAEEKDLANADAGMYSGFSESENARAMENQRIATQIAMQRAQVIPSLIGAGIGGAAGMFQGRFGGH